jgi:16S rRNA (guanine966-N2)-methyltransferase
MRIIAGRYRGRSLSAPAGLTTRPTAERLRQALFDMLQHAPWAGRNAIEGVLVLDLFAGTGALGLEALSRGAATAEFFEHDRAALAALRTNIAACNATTLVRVHPGDACQPAPGPPASLVFLDPPYGRGLVDAALAALAAAGRLPTGALIVAELARDEPAPRRLPALLAERAHGAGRIVIGRTARE